MRSVYSSLLMALVLACCGFGQQANTTPGQHRDLKYEQEEPVAAKAGIPRGYALVIGIKNYANLPAKAQLDYPERDAESIYTSLISAEGGQFPAENVHKLIGSDATLANITKELEVWLPSVTTDNDRVVVYFAGHGFLYGGKGYLAPYDVSPQDVKDSAYPMDRLGEVFGSKIKGKWKVLLTDSCHSGAITPEEDRAQLNKTLLDLNKSLFSLTASRDREQSFEGPKWEGGHGVFTYYVVKGLEGEADTNGDGKVTADELAEYVHTNVRQDTGARQNPTSERGSFDPNMILAYNPTRIRAANLPAPKNGAMVIETNMDGVEIWIDGKSAGVVNKGTPLHVPGLLPGSHTVKGVRMGYEPDGPREELIYPGQETTVSIRILIAARRKRAAVEHYDRGVEDYNKGFEGNYKKAVAEFEQALQIEPDYSQAALYLGRTYSALYDPDNARKYMKQAIDIDPDYMEARASYAGVLLDAGDLDEAIRQLNVVTNRDKNNGMAWYLLSQAFARKGDYTDGIKAGREATRLTPNNGEAHFWLAESLRQTNDASMAEAEYKQYLALTDFDSKLAGKLNYYVVGYLLGAGKKKRATQQDIWRELRGQANLGICDCEWMQKRIDPAIEYCQIALSYDPSDLFSHYRLGLLYAQKYNAQGGVSLLAAARKHFNDVLSINPEAAEADRARKYIANIDQVLIKSGTVTR